MDIVQTEWSQIFGRFILWGIVLFVLFSLIRFGFRYLLRDKKKKYLIQKYFHLAELIVWIFFFSWFLFVFAEIKSLFVFIVFGILLGVIYLLFRFWLIDIIAGVIFRNSNRINQGDSIQIKELSGKVIKIGTRTIEIENDEGISVYIPFSKLASAIYSRTESVAQTSGYSFELETSLEEDIDSVTENIKSSIIALPWSSIRKSPQIFLKGQTGKSLIFSITVFAIDRSYFGKIETHIKKKFVK
ncbi:MAG: mechanosensitive ion channel family protein [Bacteroidales bacterium]|nr:mechanosensitive ion channel family protein [Bacteroidales bacterium]